tara:strand:+ start:778 stop:1194 length:417 start_codon:yes stop_codon:yes gene_type:complete
MGLEQYNLELGLWFKNYSIETYDRDYSLVVDLTYRLSVKHHFQCRKWISKLKKYIEDNGYEIDGFMVSEYNGERNLHNHLLVVGNFSNSVGKKLIYNFWNKIGSCLIRDYDDNQGYSIYISKFLNQGMNNEWELISNL